ncbi:MAG: N-acetylmuramoyl-L-alanine amidase [Lachnospiraceae bacterium]|nr:N-acetylmuramoyl-L-alanine amidase [Lachnospiraceae bacterium]MBQ5484509.1 N-acetylmuramoyl-L-alanine amidase [Lachnospiraceae bacterium]
MKNVAKRLLAATLTLSVLVACVGISGVGASAKKRQRSDLTIGIDPGHQSRGNFSTEPMGPGSSTKKIKVAGGTHGTTSGIPEYKLTLAVAKYLKKELKARGYKVVMTRSRNDVDISNKERAEKLNKKCNIAIRLHADGAAASANGASALYPSTKNPYLKESVCKKSKKLSEKLLTAYCKGTSIRKRGLSARDDLTGTNWSKIPVALIEMGFMTNRSDDTYMAKTKNQKAMAKALADGVDAYYGFD